MSSYKAGFEPAFPTHTCDEAALSTGGTYTDHPGMTLRDWFAGQIVGVFVQGGHDPTFASQRAYKFADAMMKARLEKNLR